MPRPQDHPHLQPRQPRSLLAWSMQKQRLVHRVTGKAIAQGFGCSPSHISRVELGQSRPSRALVQYYEERFACEGLLLSILEVVDHAAEEDRRRIGGHRPIIPSRAIPGDASKFISDTIPNGTQLKAGEIFQKTWTIRNSGSVPWTGRQLERQGPLTGPGLITSERYYNVPDSQPGDEVGIDARLKAPTYECSSIAYFKMIDADGALCFPDAYQLGLEVLVRVDQ
jgi:transcriptional regulator with XRE-family HTH domain